MKKLILIDNKKNRSNPIIDLFYQDLGILMRISGFRFLKYYDDLGHLVALDWFSFAKNQTLFTIQFDRLDRSVFSQIQPHIEQILNELSIFQLVDIFFFDELALIEPYIKQIQQQIITIFSSRIPVIAAVHENNVSKLDYLQNLIFIEYRPIQSENYDRIYLDLIGELYDH